MSKENQFPCWVSLLDPNHFGGLGFIPTPPHPLHMTGFMLVISFTTCTGGRINNYKMQVQVLTLIWDSPTFTSNLCLLSVRREFPGFSSMMVNRVQAQFTSCLKVADSLQDGIRLALLPVAPTPVLSPRLEWSSLEWCISFKRIFLNPGAGFNHFFLWANMLICQLLSLQLSLLTH